MANVTVIEPKGSVKISGGIRIEKKRVAAYCRVSTNSEEQKKSYDSQRSYYEDYIKQNSDWNFVGIYADEAITGTSVDKRINFQRLINDCTSGKIDVVVTKSISRFARNTLDTLTYVRLLKEHQVEVVFEDENIHTLSMEGEMLLTVLSSVYQQEVENISANVKKGIKMKAMRGEITAFRGCLGYDYDTDTKEITVNEEEAKIVRLIFAKYLEGYGGNAIAEILTEKGCLTKKGHCKWSNSTVLDILKNEKYVGDVLIGKTYTSDPISKRRLINYGEEQKILISDHHEPIISRDVFEQVAMIRAGRNINRVGYKGEIPESRVSRYAAKYAFSGKIKCGMCGKSFVRRTQAGCSDEKKTIWACKSLKHDGKKVCPDSKIITEHALEHAFIDSYREIYNTRADMIEEFLNNVQNALGEDDSATIIKRTERKIKLAKQKKDCLLETKLKGLIDDETFNSKNTKLQAEINSREETLKHLLREKTFEKNLTKRIQSFRENICDGKPLEHFDRTLFETLVNHITIGRYENGVPNNDLITIVYSPNGNKEKIEDENTIEFINFDIYEPHFSFEPNGISVKKILKECYTVSVRIPVFDV